VSPGPQAINHLVAVAPRTATHWLTPASRGPGAAWRATGALLRGRDRPAYIGFMEHQATLRQLRDDELLRRTAEVVSRSRRAEAEIVAHIAEVDERRLFVRCACTSMFAWCVEVLHFSEAEAYLRIAAARASRAHPMLLDMLADGRLHLSGVARLAPHLTAANRDAVLARACHKPKREIEELLAELNPQPDSVARIRRLPPPQAPRDAVSSAPSSLTVVLHPLETSQSPVSSGLGSSQLFCGRDAGCPAPPAQIPARGITALGSCLKVRGRVAARARDARYAGVAESALRCVASAPR
jgi:hypothetical protein